MPTKREREYYSMGFMDGIRSSMKASPGQVPISYSEYDPSRAQVSPRRTTAPKRKLSAWNKFVKANSKKPRFRFANGKLKLKKMAIAFRKTPASKKRKR